MYKYYGVSFKSDGKIYIFKFEEDLDKGTNVIVETEKGLQFGKINILIDEEDLKLSIENIKNIVRVATEKDEAIQAKNMKDSKNALTKAVEFAKELELDMHFIDASYTFDRKQLLFNFIADDRVDFRELANI